MKNRAIIASGLVSLAMLTPLFSMEPGSQTPQNTIQNLQFLLFMDMYNGFIGKQFGDGTFAAKSNVPSLYFNHAFAVPSTTEQDVDAVIHYMDGIPFGWRVLSNQDDIKALLESKGLVCAAEGYLMQWKYQDAQISASNFFSDDKIKVERIVNRPGWKLWNTISARGARLPEEVVCNFSKYILDNANAYRVSWYLCYVNNNPVCTGVLIEHIPSRKATIHLISTIEEQPKQETLSALISEMVSDAYYDQCWPILTFASPAVHEWTLALGFTDIDTYLLYTQKDSSNSIWPTVSASTENYLNF